MQRTLPGIPPSAALHQLAEHFPRAGFFDVETATEGGITLIACLQGDTLHTFVRGKTWTNFWTCSTACRSTCARAVKCP